MIPTMYQCDQDPIQQRNLRENCGRLFVKLLQLAALKSKAIEENARVHIQDLVDSKINIDGFATHIRALLGTNFNKRVMDNLKSGMPLLRLALFRRELSIEGVSPPSSLTWGLTVQNPMEEVRLPPVQPTTMAKAIYVPPKIVTAECEDASPIQVLEATTTNIKKLKLEPVAAGIVGEPIMKPSIDCSNEDSNDVVAMCGISIDTEQHLAAETQPVSRTGQPESSFLNLAVLRSRLSAALHIRGLDDITPGVAELISNSCKDRLKGIISKLVVNTVHRTQSLKNDPNYEPSNNVREQIKFLEDVDKAEQKRTKDLEREILMRASKLKYKSDNPELARMRAKAKEMHRTEMEEMRQRDADMTALHAIGPRKKTKSDDQTNELRAESSGGQANGIGQAIQNVIRPNRPLRVTLQDLIVFMEQDPHLSRSELLYKAYLK